MKSILTRVAAVVAAIFILQVAFGQQGFMLGVKAGIDIPNLRAGKDAGSNPVSKGWSSRLGPYFGAVGLYNITQKFGIQVELNYSSQGGKKNGRQAIPTSDFTANPPEGTPQYVYANLNSETRLNYIELPIMARFSLPIGGSCHFFVQGGPYFGYLLAAKTQVKGTSAIYADEAETQTLAPQFTVDQTQDVKDDIKKFNMGIQGGIGLSARAPLGSVVLTVGGNYGFISIQKDKANGQNNTGAANVTAGYLFTL